MVISMIVIYDIFILTSMAFIAFLSTIMHIVQCIGNHLYVTIILLSRLLIHKKTFY